MPTALITGASSGLGEEFARQLALKHYDLILIARREERLNAVAEAARAAGSYNVHVAAADLSSPDAATKLCNHLQGDLRIQIDYLVNNAGFGSRGLFHKLPLSRELEEIQLNVCALVAMTRMVTPGMVERRRGTVINVASTAAFQPVPYMATYAATKAFVLNFSEALSIELNGTGVTIMALCPGPTRTEFQSVAGTSVASIPSFAYMDAKTVVEQAIAAAGGGKPLKINGVFNFLMAQATRLAPRSLTARIAGSMFRSPHA